MLLVIRYFTALFFEWTVCFIVQVFYGSVIVRLWCIDNALKKFATMMNECLN